MINNVNKLKFTHRCVEYHINYINTVLSNFNLILFYLLDRIDIFSLKIANH